MTRSEYLKTSQTLQHLFRTSAFAGIDSDSDPPHHLLHFKRFNLESWLSIEGYWQVGDACRFGGERCLVVAMPKGDLAIFVGEEIE